MILAAGAAAPGVLVPGLEDVDNPVVGPGLHVVVDRARDTQDARKGQYGRNNWGGESALVVVARVARVVDAVPGTCFPASADVGADTSC